MLVHAGLECSSLCYEGKTAADSHYACKSDRIHQHDNDEQCSAHTDGRFGHSTTMTKVSRSSSASSGRNSSVQYSRLEHPAPQPQRLYARNK
jgi:hypothetical protein